MNFSTAEKVVFSVSDNRKKKRNQIYAMIKTHFLFCRSSVANSSDTVLKKEKKKQNYADYSVTPFLFSCLYF
uniref:Uncharacterized protein n=1 Tax=Daphnia magna TaxID=35525 RepID=A0A0P6B9G4_9CRUS